jgi:hypothetical protein
MLRNLNQQYPGGERRLGLCTTGVLGSTIPGAGAGGPAWMYPSLRFPASNTREYAYWIEAHTFPSGLPLDDTSSGSFVGLADGVYAAAVALEEDGVYVGAFPVIVTVGGGLPFSAPGAVMVLLQGPEQQTQQLRANPPILGDTSL